VLHGLGETYKYLVLFTLFFSSSHTILQLSKTFQLVLMTFLAWLSKVLLRTFHALACLVSQNISENEQSSRLAVRLSKSNSVKGDT
jgi:hypothetical protein